MVIIHPNTLKQCAAVLRCSSQLNRFKLGLAVILTLFLKSAEVPLLLKRLVVLMFLVFKSILGVSGIHTFCYFLFLRIRHVNLQRLNVSGCCP